MNSNELLKEIQKRVIESGIAGLVTEFVREHPEYWGKNTYDHGVNNCCNISIAYNTLPGTNITTGTDITTVAPFFMLDIGRVESKLVSMSFHPDNNTQYTTYWYDYKVQLEHTEEYHGPRMDVTKST